MGRERRLCALCPSSLSPFLMSDLDGTAVAEILLAWFPEARRDLPWRRHGGPYAVWISEVMLQQTQADTVAPYYEAWMARFPDVGSLATASLDEVMQLWQGLGYYARARHLHRAACIIREQFCGEIPSERAALSALPGIGRSTAGAILSLGFGQPEPILDANVRRVLTRLWNIDAGTDRTRAERRLWELSQKLVADSPTDNYGELNEAVMELGALICLPRSPQCGQCPLGELCLAHRAGTQLERPARTAVRKAPHREAVCGAVLDHRGRILMARRPSHGLLGGLWGFPGGFLGTEPPPELALAEILRDELGIEVAVVDLLTRFDHAYTHFSMTLACYRCRHLSGAPKTGRFSEVRWLAQAEAEVLGLSATDRRIQRSLSDYLSDVNHPTG